MEMTKRDRRALKLGAVALGAVAVYFLAIEPVMNSYGDLVATHALQASRIKRAVYDNQKNVYLARKVGQWQSRAGELAEPKPYSEQITGVGGGIMAAAKLSGVKIKNSGWAAARPWAEDPALELAVVTIDAETGWENVFKFISGIYRIPGVLSVERMDLSSGPKKGGKLTVRLTVSVMVKSVSNVSERQIR